MERNTSFTVRPVGSPTITGFPAILSPPEYTAFFFFSQNLLEFFPALICRQCFRPEIAGIFSESKLLAYLPTRNCWHIFRPEIAGISSDTKLPAYLPTRNCQHIFRHEIASIISNPNLGHLNLYLLFFYQSNDQGLYHSINDYQCPYGEEAQTAEHILQSCQLYKELESEDLAPTNPGGPKALRLPHGSATDCSIYQRNWTDHLTFEKKN